MKRLSFALIGFFLYFNICKLAGGFAVRRSFLLTKENERFPVFVSSWFTLWSFFYQSNLSLIFLLNLNLSKLKFVRILSEFTDLSEMFSVVVPYVL